MLFVIIRPWQTTSIRSSSSMAKDTSLISWLLLWPNRSNEATVWQQWGVKGSTFLWIWSKTDRSNLFFLMCGWYWSFSCWISLQSTELYLLVDCKRYVVATQDKERSNCLGQAYSFFMGFLSSRCISNTEDCTFEANSQVSSCWPWSWLEIPGSHNHSRRETERSSFTVW